MRHLHLSICCPTRLAMALSDIIKILAQLLMPGGGSTYSSWHHALHSLLFSVTVCSSVDCHMKGGPWIIVCEQASRENKQLCIFGISDAGEDTKKRLTFSTYPQFGGGCHGRVKRQTLLLGTNIHIARSCHPSPALISIRYTNSTNLGAVVILPW